MEFDLVSGSLDVAHEPETTSPSGTSLGDVGAAPGLFCGFRSSPSLCFRPVQQRAKELRELITKSRASVADLELIGTELRMLSRNEGSDRLREQMKTNAEAISWSRATLAHHEQELDELLGF